MKRLKILFMIVLNVVIMVNLSSCQDPIKYHYDLKIEVENIDKIDILYINKDRKDEIVKKELLILDTKKGIQSVVIAIENIPYYYKKLKKDEYKAYDQIYITIYSNNEEFKIKYIEYGIKGGYVLYGDYDRWYKQTACIVGIFYENVKRRMENGEYDD